MRKIFVILTALVLTLSACGTPPSLWGEYVTPTGYAPGLQAKPEQIAPTLPTPVSEPVPATPTIPPTATATLKASLTPQAAEPTTQSTLLPTSDIPPILYYTQSGDTLNAVAARFDVDISEITSSASLPKTGLIDPGTLLVIPEKITDYGPDVQIMPDSEIIFSVSVASFDVPSYVAESGGKLATYKEYLGSAGWTTGSQAIERVAQENSVNPQLLLALLDYQSNWVTGTPKDTFHELYPMGFDNEFKKGVFIQTVLAVNELFTGYYGWRSGTLTELTFPDGSSLRIAPDLNAGSVAIQYFFSKFYNRQEWQKVIDPNIGFPAFYAKQFGDPWERAQSAGPIFPPGLSAPNLVLPFEPNREWSFTGGPHGAWEHDGPLAAIDFSPANDKSGCTESEKWLVAATAGLVVRSSDGVVVLDLDNDGHEETGWNLMYLHVATKDRVKLDTWVETNDRVGHASCEGGTSTGTHLHLARKYNGEWVLADGPLPFVLSGYVVHNGNAPYEGTLTKGSVIVKAHPAGIASTTIIRQPDE